MPGRLLAIGDIHGCHLALKALIEAIDPQPEDTIVTLGDYVDYGPDSRSVIDQLIGLSQRCRLVPLLGNYEQMILQALESDSALRSWLDIGGDQTLLSYPTTAPTSSTPPTSSSSKAASPTSRRTISSSRTPTATQPCPWTGNPRSN